jgi:hypothetical protein
MALVPQPGLVIAARYRLLHQVGAGGMGDVWAADDCHDMRVVALKLVRGDDEAARVALLREARAAQSLRHPHVLDVQEVLDVEGQPVLVMELLDGETLAARLRRTPRLTVAETVAVALPVASALGAAHAAGLVHRDLKPENVFLASAPPLVRVLDFGLARRTVIDSETAVSSGLTTTGLVIGTPAYMSPEQLYGDRDLDHRADLWSLGVVLYQCLTGILPTAGDNLGQVIKAIVARPFEPLSRLRPEVPAPLADLVGRLLSRDRADRPFDASEAFDVLAAVDPAAAREIPRPPPLPLPPVRKTPLPRKRHRRAVFAAIPIAIALGVAFLFVRRPPVAAALQAPFACPPWKVIAPSSEERWLGVAAAATACERLRVLLGGAPSLTFSPAELLGLPPRPLDREDPLESSGAREAAERSARNRNASVLDGEVAVAQGRFKVRLHPERGGPGFEGPSLYEAIRAAMDGEEKRGALRRATVLDPAWAEWSRASDVASALALLDLVFALAQNAGSLEATCRDVEAQPGIDAAMKQVVRWYCAYTRGVPAEPPRFTATGPGEVALLARARHSASGENPPETIDALKKLLDAEKTPLGRSTLATTLSCLVQARDAEAARRYALIAVREDPRNLLGEFCAPWGQAVDTTRATASASATLRAMQAWSPWDSNSWHLTTDPGTALDHARRAYLLSPLDATVANVFADRLLAADRPEEARAVAVALSSGPDPVHAVASELIQVRVESIAGRFARSRDRALRTLRAASDADTGWILAQRLEAGVFALQAADLLGNGSLVAGEVAERLVLRDPPLLDGAYFLESAYVPTVCAHCVRAVARRCFRRFKALREKFSGSILDSTDSFAEGARLWNEGDRPGAAAAFRVLLGAPDPYVELLSLPMAQAFASIDDERRSPSFRRRQRQWRTSSTERSRSTSSSPATRPARATGRPRAPSRPASSAPGPRPTPWSRRWRRRATSLRKLVLRNSREVAIYWRSAASCTSGTRDARPCRRRTRRAWMRDRTGRSNRS